MFGLNRIKICFVGVLCFFSFLHYVAYAAPSLVGEWVDQPNLTVGAAFYKNNLCAFFVPERSKKGRHLVRYEIDSTIIPHRIIFSNTHQNAVLTEAIFKFINESEMKFEIIESAEKHQSQFTKKVVHLKKIKNEENTTPQSIFGEEYHHSDKLPSLKSLSLTIKSLCQQNRGSRCEASQVFDLIKLNDNMYELITNETNTLTVRSFRLSKTVKKYWIINASMPGNTPVSGYVLSEF